MPLLMVPRDHLKGHPATPSAYLALAAAASRKVGRPLVADGRCLIAYVAHGMWIADCPHCNSGIAIHPEWSVAACFGRGCYRTFASVQVPAEWSAIEVVLAMRPQANQNWLSAEVRGKRLATPMDVPSETVDDLWQENMANGVTS